MMNKTKTISREEAQHLMYGDSICPHCHQPCNYLIEANKQGQIQIRLQCCDTILLVQEGATMNTPLNPNVQHWLNDPDIGQARILKSWLEEELKVSVEQVLSIDIHADVKEMSPDGQYKRFEPEGFNRFTLTLLNGNKLYRSFRRGE